MARKSNINDNFKENKNHFESTVSVGKSLLEFILVTQHRSVPNYNYANLLKDQLGMSNNKMKSAFNKNEVALLEGGAHYDKLDKLDLSMLYKLIYHLCDFVSKAPELQKDLQALKENRNEIAHIVDITQFTDLFIWQKIEELRALFEKILNGIKEFYQIDIADKNKDINNKIDEILRDVEVQVGDYEVGLFLSLLDDVGSCPFKVKIEIKDFPLRCSDLLPLLEKIGKENTKVKLLMFKTFFDDVDVRYYDSKKYLTPLLDKGSKCKLSWYKGSLSNEMIYMLPDTMKQLYIRMRSDQVEHLNKQLHTFPDLWSLVLYLDVTHKNSVFRFDNIDPSSLPLLEFKGKQLGLKFRACIDTTKIPWIIDIIKRLTQEHQCDTLEFYQTRLNTGLEVETLLRALHEADVHVTTWVKVQNEKRKIDTTEEKRLSILARNLSLRMFKFLRYWQ